MATRGAPAFYSPYGPMGQDPEQAAKEIALAGRGAYGYGKDFVGMLASALRHPVDTANNAWDAGKQIGSQLLEDPVGLGKQVVMGEWDAMKGAAQDPEKLGAYAASFIDPIKLLGRGKQAATMAMAAGKKGGRGSAKPNLQRDGVPIKDLTDAEKRWGNGEQIFGFHEMDGAPSRITSLEMLNNYQPDQLMALPNKAPSAPAAQQIPDALRGFGDTKAKREAATAARLKAQQAAPPAEPGTRAKGAGKREKADATLYRRMYEEQGPEAVLRAAQRGEHLKPKPGGGYVGAPRTVQTGPQLGAVRRSFDSQVQQGADAISYADPGRMGTWYDRAKEGFVQSTEPHQLDRALDNHAVYSAGVAPETELAFSTKHGNSRALGTGEMAYRTAGMNTLDNAVAADAPTKLAPKVGEYRGKNDPRRPETSPFGVNDFRNAQAWSYTDPAGNPWKAGATPQMHQFMDAESALAVERANTRGTGGLDNWTGAMLQEVPWVYNKAEDIYGRGKKGRFKGGEIGMVAALREANKTTADFFPKHAGSATYEYVPGANTGHVPQVADMSFDQRKAYGDVGRWDPEAQLGPGQEAFRTPYGEVGAGRRDALYSALGFRQLPSIDSVGNYTNSAGVLEQNPMTIARPLLDFRTGGKGIAPNTVNPNTDKATRAVETLRGVVDAQEAMAMNLPVTMASRKGKTNLLLDRGMPPNREEMNNILNALRGTGFEGDVTATNRGALIFNFKDEPAKAQRQLLKRQQALEAALPGSLATKAGNEGFYVPAMSSADEANQGIATTRALQAFADAPEAAALNVSESESVRDIIKQKMARDEARGGARPDIQEMRKFFAEADWSKAVKLMRQGMTPAAAVAALGYSLNAMAGEAPPDVPVKEEKRK